MKKLITFATLLSLGTWIGCDQMGTKTQPSSKDSSAAHGHDHAHDHDHAHGSGEYEVMSHDYDGKGKSAPKDTDYAKELSKVEGVGSTILKAFKDGKPDEAHDALHEIGHQLEDLPALAAKYKTLTEEESKQVAASVEVLFNAFGELDGTMHGGAEVDLADIEKRVSESMAQLKTLIQ